jgi:chemotaxis-related protein WspD
MTRPLALAAADSACWNSIGVRGDRSCPVLREHVHCRNCPVYSHGASKLLDRELSSDYQSDWQERFTAAKVASIPSASTQSLFIFRLGQEWLALPTRVIEEVVELRATHSIPHRRNGVVLGLVNVRGELLIGISLYRLLGVGDTAAPAVPLRSAQARMLVLARGASRFVARADHVHGPERCDGEQLLPAPATVARATAAFSSLVLPWQSTSVGILDDERLFDTLDRMLS